MVLRLEAAKELEPAVSVPAERVGSTRTEDPPDPPVEFMKGAILRLGTVKALDPAAPVPAEPGGSVKTGDTSVEFA